MDHIIQGHAGRAPWKGSKCHAFRRIIWTIGHYAGIHLGISEPNHPGNSIFKWWRRVDLSDIFIFKFYQNKRFKSIEGITDSISFTVSPLTWLCLLVALILHRKELHRLAQKFRKTGVNIKTSTKHRSASCFFLHIFFLRTLFCLYFSRSHRFFSGISSRTRCSVSQNHFIFRLTCQPQKQGCRPNSVKIDDQNGTKWTCHKGLTKKNQQSSGKSWKTKVNTGFQRVLPPSAGWPFPVSLLRFPKSMG